MIVIIAILVSVLWKAHYSTSPDTDINQLVVFVSLIGHCLFILMIFIQYRIVPFLLFIGLAVVHYLIYWFEERKNFKEEDVI
ncbi:hypothetical protein ACE4RR_13695 [Alteribacillus sp. HJP-4]